MDTTLGLGGRNALHAMHATLIPQTAEDIIAADLENHFLIPPGIAGAGLDQLLLEAVGLGVAGIHPVEIARKNRSLGATGTGPDLDDGIAVVIRLGREQGKHDRLFQLGNSGGDFLDL